MPDSSLTYHLDRNHRINFVTGPWDKFAQENEGAGVLVRDVIGRPIWQFIVGDVTKGWLQALLQRIRVSGEPLERAYRCDSPHLQRFMRMRIAPLHSGEVALTHTVIETREKTPPVRFYYWSSEQEARARCSICGRINVNGEWREAAVRDCGVAAIGVRYTVCTTCMTLTRSAGSVHEACTI